MVLVACHDINIFVTRIPVVIIQFRCPDLDKIMYAMFHQITLGVKVKLFEGLCPIVTPPEPGLAASIGIARCFMEGSPKDGYSLSLVMKKVADDGVQVLIDDAVFRSAGLNSSTW